MTPAPFRIRRANQQIAATAARQDYLAPIPLIGECGSPDCLTVVKGVLVSDFDRIRATPTWLLCSPTHDAPDGTAAIDTLGPGLIVALSPDAAGAGLR